MLVADEEEACRQMACGRFGLLPELGGFRRFCPVVPNGARNFRRLAAFGAMGRGFA
jgi:hypothetical protein